MISLVNLSHHAHIKGTDVTSLLEMGDSPCRHTGLATGHTVVATAPTVATAAVAERQLLVP